MPRLSTPSAQTPAPSRLPTAAVLQEGRGSFKSTLLIDLAAHRLLGFDAAPYVARGSEVVAIIVSPAKKQAAETWCVYASNHAKTCGGKPWRYALIAHDVITENMSLASLVGSSPPT